MRLKTLTIQGFKSFPEKVTIQFNRGVTAVVGPNGSGKSNISDAIRWVLGEQSSKTLRVKNMEDLIFGGTPFQKPRGFAYVALTIDNTSHVLPLEEEEVTISRKLFRSGDSEYRINHNLVRLKDIYELFLDTGLGRDGYSIIGQGKISEIISAKSTDRRDIFEEAAGISKFRYRKEEAQRRLAAAEENLVRVRDILSELEGRIEPLRKQADKAQTFLKLSEQKKTMDISLAVWQFDSFRDGLRQLDNQLCIAKEHHQQLERQAEELETAIQANYSQIQQLAVQIDTRRRKIHDNETELSESSSRTAVLETNIFYAEEAILRLEKEAAQLTEEIQQGCDQLTQQQNQKETLIHQLAEQKELEILTQRQVEENSSVLQDFFAATQKLNEQLQAAATEIGEMNYRLAQLETEANNYTARMEELEERISSHSRKQSQFQEQMQELQAYLERRRGQIRAGEERIEAGEAQLEQARSALDSQKAQLEKQQANRNTVAQRMGILQDLEKNHEGFYGSVKKIMSAAESGRLSGIYGTVSQLISVEQRYATAVEIAMGPSLQHLVCQGDQEAKAGIAYLKQGGFGRATFLPLSNIRAPVLSLTEQEKVPGFVATAARLVSCDSQFDQIVASLLGRTLICQDLDSASQLAQRTGHRYKIVTLDGQVINAGGSYTGGSLIKNTGLLSRKTEIASLQKQLGQLGKLVEQQNQAVLEATQLMTQLEEKQRQRKAILDAAKQELYRKNLERENLERDVQLTKGELLQAQQEKERFSSALIESGSKVEDLKRAVQQKEEQQLDIFDQIQRENLRTADLRKENETLINRRNTLSLKNLSLQKDLDRLEGLRQDLEAAQKERATKSASMLSQRQEEEDKISNFRQQIQETVEKRNALTQENQEQDASITRLMAQRDSMEQAIAQKRIQQKERSTDRERLSVEVARLTERMNALQGEQDKVISHIWDEYELTKSQAFSMAQPIENHTAVQAELNRLKNTIRALGNVNVGAIEEFQEVSQRYNFMTGQVADIEASKADLQDVIRDLEQNMQTIFSDSFQRINRTFSQLFTQFFEGGEACLELTDPENLLESGVEITVQPPGKIIKNLASLSGGEQSFVAIALYFAILQERPSPFCVLDEIESALDDVNVGKYARYLREICGSTQFIVITHRRGTMENADVLYGVTTQQDGVSRVLTLDLNQAVETVGK